MAHPLKLPALGALAVSAAAFGLHLGESAVADINPVHFQGPAVHPRDRGAVVADMSAEPVRSDFAMAYGWDQGASARSADCPGCGPAGSTAYAPRAAGGYQSEVDAALAQPRQPRAAPAAQQWQDERPDAFTTEYAAVDRYARYQVEQVPAEQASAEEAPTDAAEYAEYEE